jgi:hypothetical protein
MQNQLSKDKISRILVLQKKVINGTCGDMLAQNMVEHFLKQPKMVLYVFIKVHPFQFYSKK